MEKIQLQGILYDEKSSYLRGPAKAPPLIRDAYLSDAFNFFAENGSEIRPDLFLDRGDFNVEEYFDIEQISLDHLKQNIPMITLGGDHSITYPVLRAFSKVYGPLEILHIDAHADLYDSFEGDKYSHACPFARIMEENLASRLVQVGIRTFSTHQREQAELFGVEVIEMRDFRSGQLPAFKGPLYLSLDIDALDPAFAPGISHHEPGGFSSRQVIEIIQGIDAPLVGADIVEFNPVRDINGVTATVCAKFLKEIAARILATCP
ncbi:agmatinase family protein [Lentiprolixibacter aurantiacus]|uniref:Agmatinase family protein n=1 Tax=Lentiprolixibacter aurantiacus TaxID=2993939 RepID=A0AAE3SNG6_9FLAO|nr:agmatinase family protein [Lentiprolixibacter aurantiacus]MCX2719505.1 agmatinase family protein [Lentiprolixibacter aurantiacus]